MMPVDNPYHPPIAVAASVPAVESRSLLALLFSFRGRIPRRTYWGASLAVGFVAAIAVAAVGLVFKNDDTMVILCLLPVYAAYIWAILALGAKRWHDRGKDAWWLLIGLIPLIGGVWQLVECGFLRGDLGPNHYGDDPT